MPAPFISRPTDGLVELFSSPPAAFSPVPLWWWSGDTLDPVRLRQQMELLIAGGVRQAVVMNLAPSGPLYGALADEPAFFSDAWWSLFEGVCRDADELGFSLWFYDQLGFSGADIQGRLVQRVPPCRGQALEQVSIDVDGDGLVTCPPDGEPLAAFALPAGGSPIRLPVRDRSAVWSGTGRLLLAYSVPRGFDYLDRRSCALLLDSVHGEFERRLGKHLGSTIVGSFQDELPSMPTWSQRFVDEFRARRGYDLVDRVHALWSDGDDDVRADYQRTRAELAEEAFFRPLFEWHRERGLVVGCDQQHPARAGYPVEATQQYGDYLRTHRWFSAPGSDHWGDAKVHSSLAHLYDRPRTWVEAFHSSGWGGTLEETYDWLLPWLRAGANLYDPHAVYYSTVGGRWEWAPPSTCWRQPYWRHYPLFSRAVTRLCAALSWGDHVCDVGVLYPTRTAQCEVRLDQDEALLGQSRGTSLAQDVYLDVVGRMHWFEPEPGALDRDGRDFDVLDDDSVARATVVDGRLCIGAESYGVVVLPACTEVEPGTARVLRAFADAGGVLVAVGAVADLLADVTRFAPTPSDLEHVLADVPRRVESTAPTLLRSDGESSALLVLGAFPGATVQPAGRAWRTEGYSFDPSRYARSVPVTVRGLPEPVALWDPGTGTARPLPATRHGDELRVDVPLDAGPCGLLVFGPAAAADLLPKPGEVFMATAAAYAGDVRTVPVEDWTGELIPTSDNTWGDFGWPPSPGPGPFRVWNLEHQREQDGPWQPARATFGPRGEVRRRGGAWQPLIWSDRLGPATERTEPRGYVPEEFLDLGDVAAGEQLELRFRLRAEHASTAFLAVGSTAGKRIRWNGQDVQCLSSVYLDNGTVDVRQGDNLLEITLIAPTARRLRASWTLRSSREELPRPEWLTGDLLCRAVELLAVPETAELQLGTIGRVTVRVNGRVVARHGEFDNYSHVGQARVRRYDVREHLAPGHNEITLELHEPQSAAVIDMFLDDLCVVTDGSWQGATGGVDEVPHDTRWVQLRPRPHPLPGVDDGDSSVHVSTLQAAGSATTERFRFRLPPGARELRLPVGCVREVTVDGERIGPSDGVYVLASPATAGAVVTIAVEGAGGGASWAGPAEVSVTGRGSLPLGDWSVLGLHDWSGGVRYRAVIPGPVDARALDLGAVRGTAELRVNGRPAGCRIWSPYRFDVQGLLTEAENVLEVDVYNTLAPHVAAVSPSPWVLPGQHVSGLLGPVTLVLQGQREQDHPSRPRQGKP